MTDNLISMEWFAVINNYVNLGKIDGLVELVRNEGVPKLFSRTVADILSGKLKPISPQQKGIAKRQRDA